MSPTAEFCLIFDGSIVLNSDQLSIPWIKTVSFLISKENFFSDVVFALAMLASKHAVAANCITTPMNLTCTVKHKDPLVTCLLTRVIDELRLHRVHPPKFLDDSVVRINLYDFKTCV
jgi:hypothetical protein